MLSADTEPLRDQYRTSTGIKELMNRDKETYAYLIARMGVELVPQGCRTAPVWESKEFDTAKNGKFPHVRGM